MEHKVIGTTMPVLEMQLDAGESIVAEGTLKVRPGMIVSPKPFVLHTQITQMP